MNFDHDEEHLFICNDQGKTLEQLIAEFSDMPTDGADVSFANRSNHPTKEYPQVQVKFRNSSSPGLYKYLVAKISKANTHMDHFRAAMFSENIDMLCAFDLKNWLQIVP